MNQGQVLLRYLGISAFGDGKMLVPSLRQAGVALPVVRDDHRALFDRVVHESAKAFPAPVWDDGETQPPRVPSAATCSALADFVRRLPRTYLDGPRDDDAVVDTLAFAARLTAHVGLVHLAWELAADLVPSGPHHTRAELVEDLEGSLVPREPELALKLDGAHAGRH